MNENPQDEGRDFSTPDILFQISPTNEMKERTKRSTNGALLLSLFRLEVWFFSQVSDALPILLLLLLT
jgi:hypothetical protein